MGTRLGVLHIFHIQRCPALPLARMVGIEPWHIASLCCHGLYEMELIQSPPDMHMKKNTTRRDVWQCRASDQESSADMLSLEESLITVSWRC
jgi:hypothetical protein